jgi:hypothetical protein
MRSTAYLVKRDPDILILGILSKLSILFPTAIPKTKALHLFDLQIWVVRLT